MKGAHAIVVVSHSMKFVRETCTKALWMSNGRMAAYGDPDDVVNRYLAATAETNAPVRALS
jgi:teichoic acid transport system ATP-binding protein